MKKKELEKLSKSELIDLLVGKQTIPTASEAREMTLVADRDEELRVKGMLEEVYLHIMEYVSEHLSKIKTGQRRLDVPRFTDDEDFRCWERVGEDEYAGGPIPSMESAWERAATELRTLGYQVTVEKKERSYSTVMSLYICW